MIIYFSATGNSEHVATVIAEETGQPLISLERCMKDGSFRLEVAKGDMLGLVAPVYAMGMPSILVDFFQKAEFIAKQDTYTFFAATYGFLTGSTGTQARRMFQEKGLSLSGRFSVKMPDTWTPVFDVSNKDRIQQRNRQADAELLEVVHRIKQEEKGDFMKDRLPAFLAEPYYKLGYRTMQKTVNFHVEDSCTGCGRCARLCPGEAIQIRSQRPIWVKDHCIMCLRCLHRCPEFAIQYGNKTKKHGQYSHPSIQG